VWNQGRQQYSSLYKKVNKLEATMQRFIQLYLPNEKNIEALIQKLDVQVNILVKQLATQKTRLVFFQHSSQGLRALSSSSY